MELAIKKPENCEAHLSSARDPSVSYHSVDNPYNANFAMVSFGSAGLRVFDIRNPRAPIEVKYFNRRPFLHAGVSHYDAERGLMLAPHSGGLKVLEAQPPDLRSGCGTRPTRPTPGIRRVYRPYRRTEVAAFERSCCRSRRVSPRNAARRPNWRPGHGW